MALVISRRDQEGLLIGENIFITIHINKSNQVKLEIDAPKEVVILREELIRPESTAEEENYLRSILRS